MMLSKVIAAWCLIVKIVHGQLFPPGVTLESSHDFTLNVTIENNEVAYFVMQGPADLWFGVGWDSDVMSGTYAMIVTDEDDTIVERSLGNYNSGTVLDSTITVVIDFSFSGSRLVIFYRNASAPSADYYDFSDVGGTEIDIIWAVGSSATFGAHNTTNRGSTSMEVYCIF